MSNGFDDFEDEKTTSFFGGVNTPYKQPVQQPAEQPVQQPVQQPAQQDEVIDDFEDEKTTSFFGGVNTPYKQPIQQYAQQSAGGFAPNQGFAINSYLDFYNAFASKNTNNFITALFVCSIISAVILVPSIALGDLLGVLDIALILTFSIICKSKKVSWAALALMIYIIVSLVLNFVLFGIVSAGFFPLVCSIIVFKNLKKLEKAYKLYGINGELPVSQI